jgi:hypothetical protein
VYHLTAHCAIDKRGYGALWCEATSGRSGNDLASALIQILELIVGQHPTIKRLILWSDSCVAQNRNSIMSFALQNFLRTHPEIKTIEQKFCEPGHSSIQEVDNIHSHIEKVLSVSAIYSPLSLLRALLQVTPKRPLIIKQMTEGNFFNYKEAAKKLMYSVVPYSTAKHIRYHSGQDFTVEVKQSFRQEFRKVNIINDGPSDSRSLDTRRKTRSARSIEPDDTVKPSATSIIKKWPTVETMCGKPNISEEKKKDIKDMLKYMPIDDVKYLTGILGL